ncbi:hypothetical protein [Aquabacterium sp. A08]|uniref:hypothetical protein n=1 Tax=Aquabacterium sp. A08 TaxID=2718532 RepID=UPI001AAFF87A|nr:hypothetical protein [Aquabacterium sp. A08]
MSAGGWIGAWSPGIGDPTLGGWLAVASYLLAGLLCAAVWRGMGAHGHPQRREAMGYAFLAASLLLLGLNKQLDLQTALTELGRVWAHQQGWYEDRQRVQLAFMAMMAILGLTGGAVVALYAWRLPLPTRCVWLAWMGLGVFVVLRAASFHHMDRFIGDRALGVAWNHWLELGCLWTLAGCTAWRMKLRREYQT